jgi:methionyl-tRNA synthetase
VRGHYDDQAMHLALEAIWSVLGAANKYFSVQEPWVLRKTDTPDARLRFRTVLYTTLEVLRIAALLTQPVMPESTGRLLDLLGQPDDARTFAVIGTRLTPGTPLPAPAAVFPRYQPE